MRVWRGRGEGVRVWRGRGEGVKMGGVMSEG